MLNQRVAGNHGANLDFVLSGLREMEERKVEEEKKEEFKNDPPVSAAAASASAAATGNAWTYNSPSRAQN